MKTHNNYSYLSQNFLNKSKKYYKKSRADNEKQNIISGDISSIARKLNDPTLPSISTHHRYNKKPFHSFSHRSSKQHNNEKFTILNKCVSFQKEEKFAMQKKDLQNQINSYIKRLKQPHKNNFSIFQEYLSLCQQTNDYLEYYLINYVGEQQGKASQLFKDQGKAVALLLLKKKYKCFQSQGNPPDILNRIMLAFNLNPFNDFQFVSWQKFMKIRKLINGEINRRDYTDFFINYFFASNAKVISGSQFWSIFNSVIRKISFLLDQHTLDCLLKKIADIGTNIIKQESELTRQKLRVHMTENPMFLWQEFVILAFV